MSSTLFEHCHSSIVLRHVSEMTFSLRISGTDEEELPGINHPTNSSARRHAQSNYGGIVQVCLHKEVLASAAVFVELPSTHICSHSYVPFFRVQLFFLQMHLHSNNLNLFGATLLKTARGKSDLIEKSSPDTTNASPKALAMWIESSLRISRNIG